LGAGVLLSGTNPGAVAGIMPGTRNEIPQELHCAL
jgi:hypothetical protein